MAHAYLPRALDMGSDAPSPSLSPWLQMDEDDGSDLLGLILPHPQFVVPSSGDEGIRTVPLPGVRCPKCAKEGKEVWVIQGRACGYCGTACV